MADDPVASFLADVRMQAEDHHLVPGADARRLVAALDRVLAVHRRAPGHDGKSRCAWCRTSSGVRELWPCGEYQAISAALLGEEADHGS